MPRPVTLTQPVKLTVRVPAPLLTRTKHAAITRGTSVQALVVAGLKRVLAEPAKPAPKAGT